MLDETKMVRVSLVHERRKDFFRVAKGDEISFFLLETKKATFCHKCNKEG